MASVSYLLRRKEIETYFDRTAVDAWTRLTSDGPVSGIRATVRAGRDRMRSVLLDWLPADLSGRRVLDAGCGTGALAVEVARRGADVVAVDLSPRLVEIGRERLAPLQLPARIEFKTGDFLDPELGRFDHVVAMDSLIHYSSQDAVAALAGIAARTQISIAFTYAPWTPAGAAMHTLGRLFPRGERAPDIRPVSQNAIRAAISSHPALSVWRAERTLKVVNGFYISQAMELVS